jgi:hypothetical protein
MAESKTSTSRPRNEVAAAEFKRETTPKIDPAEPEAIEHFLLDNGPCRRITTVYLSKVWRSTTRQIAEDREFALAAAVTFLALEGSRANYFSLAALMEDAYGRLRAALQQRPDFEALLEEASRHEALH